MTPEEARAALTGCRLFQHVEDPGLGRLAAMARARRFRRGEHIFQEGDACPGVYVVLDGLVRVFKLGPSGKEQVLHLAGPATTFAEVAVIGGFPCPAFAAALEQSACLLLPAEGFRRALEQDHLLCRQLLLGLAGWVRQLVTLVEDVTLRDAVGRVARYLTERAGGAREVELPSLKKHLASHLNLTSETLSRTLRRLTDAKVIRRGEGQAIVIADPGALADAAAGLYPPL